MATSLTPEALVGIPRVGGPSVSASGARFAFVVTEIDSHSGKSRRSLFDGPSDGSEPPAPLFRARPGESLSRCDIVALSLRHGVGIDGCCPRGCRD